MAGVKDSTNVCHPQWVFRPSSTSSLSSTDLFIPWSVTSALERRVEGLRGERNDPEVNQLGAT